MESKRKRERKKLLFNENSNISTNTHYRNDAKIRALEAKLQLMEQGWEMLKQVAFLSPSLICMCVCVCVWVFVFVCMCVCFVCLCFDLFSLSTPRVEPPQFVFNKVMYMMLSLSDRSSLSLSFIMIQITVVILTPFQTTFKPPQESASSPSSSSRGRGRGREHHHNARQHAAPYNKNHR